MPDQKKRGRPKKMNAATTNIKITKETQQLVRILSETLDMNMSDALKTFILRYAPEIGEEMQRREEWRKLLSGNGNGDK